MTKIGEQQLIKAAQEAADIASTYIEPVTRSDIIRWGPVVKLNNFDPRYHPKEYVPMDDDRSFIEATNKQIDNYFHLGEDGVMEESEGKTPHDRPKTASDGGSTKYYFLPEHAKELRHLISHKGMSKARGDVFKACYRLGEKEGVDALYDLNKMKFFVQDLIEMYHRGERL